MGPSGRPRAGLGVEGDLKSVLLRPVFLTQAEVPFPDMSGPVIRAVQHFSQRDEIEIKIILALRIVYYNKYEK